MKDFGKMIQEQKPNGNDVKCAEIKTLHTSANGFSDKLKNVFKIGEYNRATASFEMSSSEDLRQKRKSKKEPYGEGEPCHLFKSSFARSVVMNNTNESKSLDYIYVDRKTNKNDGGKDSENGFWSMPGKENWDLRRAQPVEIRDDESTNGSVIGEQVTSGNKKSDVLEEHLRNQVFSSDRSVSRSSSSAYQTCFSSHGDRRLDDILVRSPLTTSCRSNFQRSYSSASDVDSVMLQSQVTTLQWQLRQAEASRQMYRAVMEQVVSFLQKTHKNLDILQNRIDDNEVDNVTRVPRSRSVHAVDTSPTRFSSPKSQTLSFQKAKSYGQIGDPDCPKHGAIYRELNWRRTRKPNYDSDDITPSKLSEEAYRLLRTVKSLLNTREPDLSSRLSTTCSSPANIADVSSASSTVSAALDSDNSDHFQGKETREALRSGTPIKDSAERRRSSVHEVEGKGSPPQLSLSSADDESGFSSLNSFQEIGVPLANSTFSHPKRASLELRGKKENYQEIGLPKVDDTSCKVHRRWSSTPVESHLTKLRPASLYTNGDVLRVLWV